jgi:hypothetical protein
MAENKNDFEDLITNLALLTEGVQALFPKSKTVLIYELQQQDFNIVKSNFKYIKIDEKQIKLDISGTEIVFILEGSYNENITPEPEPEIPEPKIVEEKISFWKRLFMVGKKL